MQQIRTTKTESNRAILLLHCPDKRGIVATVTDFLYQNNANIISIGQHVDHQEKVFYMRVEWELDDFGIPKEKISDFFSTLIAEKYNMNWKLYFSTDKPRMAVWVSKMSHCLFDILSRYTAGEWNVEIPLIISNHPNMQAVAERFDIDYYHIPINKENKAEQEAKERELLEKYEIDFSVLARYMQVLSDDFVSQFPNKIINIHHSFLPAFAGAKPYHAAHARGVKIIGATSHYVTSDLDEGPIIVQDVEQCSHVDTVESLIRKGRDLEKIILSKAISKHLERKLLVYKNRTVVFN